MSGYALYVSAPYATFLLIVSDEGVITDAPPIARWTIGKNAYEVGVYYRDRKGAHVESMP